MNTPIAETSAIFRSPAGVEKEIRIAIGLPYRISDNEAACPISMHGLYDRIEDIHGADTFQALALTIAFIRVTVKAWEKKGYTIALYDAELPPEVWFSEGRR